MTIVRVCDEGGAMASLFKLAASTDEGIHVTMTTDRQEDDVHRHSFEVEFARTSDSRSQMVTGLPRSRLTATNWPTCIMTWMPVMLSRAPTVEA